MTGNEEDIIISLHDKIEELEQQKAELINLLCERCDYIGACEVEEILCAVKKYK